MNCKLVVQTDRLAAMVTNLIAPLLSDVEGLYDGDPADANSKIISTVTSLDDSIWSLVRDRATGLSKGGMASKLKAAGMAITAGENVVYRQRQAAGHSPHILAGETVGTLLGKTGRIGVVVEAWLGLAAEPRGRLVVDYGARRAIEQQGRSLLAIGIVGVSGAFRKGDVVAIDDAAGKEFARGLSNYTADEIQRIKGLKTDDKGRTWPLSAR